MRIAVLWTHLSGYFDACLRRLAAIDGVEIFVSYMRPDAAAPFDASYFEWIRNSYQYGAEPEHRGLLRQLEAFAPDVMLTSSWHVRSYRAIARELRPRPLRVLCMDNQWLATPKQWAGVLAAPLYISPLYDAAFVPGERQASFARKLGFDEQQIWRGLYACDHDLFSSAMRHRRASLEPREAYVCIARLSPEKGIDTLARAYAQYRAAVARPWPLIVCGTGPLKGLLQDRDGVELRGFVQPSSLPGVLASAGAMVLASRFEPWGVVIQESAAAGTPVICSSACGAADHLVTDGYSGYLTAPGDTEQLASALVRFANLSPKLREQMGNAAYTLSLQFTPDRWAEYVVSQASQRLARPAPG